MPTCTLIQSTSNETYAPNPFENTENIKFYHNHVPRFGNTNEALNLLQGTPDQQQEYTQGLLSTPILLAVLIMIWILVLWVFKCCSSKHYDWLAGKPVPLPEEPNYRQREIDLENSTSDETNWEVSVFKKIQGSRTELRLGQNRKGGLIAVRVDEQGLLYGDLRVGQRIISIHGNPPEENDEESNEEDHDGTNVSQAKVLVQKKMKGGTRNLVQTVKTKTKDIGGVKNRKTLAGADNVAEGMRTLIDQ